MIAVIKNTFRESLVQPFALFAIILCAAVVVLVTFGVTLNYEHGMLMSIGLFGTPFDQNAAIVRDTLAETTSLLLNAALMFLFILGAAFVPVDMLKNPLTTISLVAPVSRTRLLLGKLLGAWCVAFLIFAGLWVALWLVLSIKSSGQIPPTVLLGVLSLSLEFAVILALAGLMAMVVQNSTAVTILCLVLYFYLGPLLGPAGSSSAFARVIAMLFPPLAEMQTVSRTTILGDPGDFTSFLRAVPHTLVCLLAAILLFRRKDLT